MELVRQRYNQFRIEVISAIVTHNNTISSTTKFGDILKKSDMECVDAMRDFVNTNFSDFVKVTSSKRGTLGLAIFHGKLKVGGAYRLQSPEAEMVACYAFSEFKSNLLSFIGELTDMEGSTANSLIQRLEEVLNNEQYQRSNILELIGRSSQQWQLKPSVAGVSLHGGPRASGALEPPIAVSPTTGASDDVETDVSGPTA